MFKSSEISLLFNAHKESLETVLVRVDSQDFEAARAKIVSLQAVIEDFEKVINDVDDEPLNELFVFKAWLKLFEAYIQVWDDIRSGSFSASWSYLQDALQQLRLIKKFSGDPYSHQIEFFENQLLELEKLYPYDVFTSVGAIVSLIKCSICGEDIDSSRCPHIKGELYRGKMAHGIISEAKLDHVAFVPNPIDKRCVIQFSDDAPQFRLLRYLANLINDNKVSPSRVRAEFTKKRVENPQYVHQPRNALCECRSGLKFKKCCITKRYLETDHIDIVDRVSWICFEVELQL